MYSKSPRLWLIKLALGKLSVTHINSEDASSDLGASQKRVTTSPSMRRRRSLSSNILGRYHWFLVYLTKLSLWLRGDMMRTMMRMACCYLTLKLSFLLFIPSSVFTHPWNIRIYMPQGHGWLGVFFNLVVFIVPFVIGRVVEITVTSTSYSPQNVNATEEDTIQLVFTGSTGTFTQTSLGAPCVRTGGLNFVAPGQFTFQLTATDALFFFNAADNLCQEGFVGTINASPDQLEQLIAKVEGSQPPSQPPPLASVPTTRTLPTIPLSTPIPKSPVSIVSNTPAESIQPTIPSADTSAPPSASTSTTSTTSESSSTSITTSSVSTTHLSSESSDSTLSTPLPPSRGSSRSSSVQAPTSLPTSTVAVTTTSNATSTNDVNFPTSPASTNGSASHPRKATLALIGGLLAMLLVAIGLLVLFIKTRRRRLSTLPQTPNFQTEPALSRNFQMPFTSRLVTPPFRKQMSFWAAKGWRRFYDEEHLISPFQIDLMDSASSQPGPTVLPIPPPVSSKPALSHSRNTSRLSDSTIVASLNLRQSISSDSLFSDESLLQAVRSSLPMFTEKKHRAKLSP
ncbi:hypothetical protein M422DRAFT_785624 [Sphaerobolus stellatus SS14]|uniref:Unplaced genomic scaffold SPHSTscaffold_347, whole genome shotgun sequence n=1 Tax=Sphaerobolus stellatus (strain SS14) TaxID=990650 RepID=A0A0C9UIR6_SPHS4|nr:hypothetical protein M422DRAFT_785624 [Sphaerobolus stellatus SS14]